MDIFIDKEKYDEVKVSIEERDRTDKSMSFFLYVFVYPILGFLVAFFVIGGGGMAGGGDILEDAGAFVAGLFAGIVGYIVVFIYTAYSLIERQNTHFKRHKALEKSIISVFDDLDNRYSELKLFVFSSNLKNISNQASQEEGQQSAGMWLFLMLVPVVNLFAELYVLYFLTETVYKHNLRQTRFLEEVKTAGNMAGIPVAAPPISYVQPRSFITSLILCFVIPFYFFYWAYTIFADYNKHFKEQHLWEDNFLSATKSYVMDTGPPVEEQAPTPQVQPSPQDTPQNQPSPQPTPQMAQQPISQQTPPPSSPPPQPGTSDYNQPQTFQPEPVDTPIPQQDQSSATLRVRVVDLQGSPLSNIVVTLQGPDTLSMNTNHEGVAEFSNLTPGQNFSISTTGENLASDISTIGLNAGMNHIEIAAKPTKGVITVKVINTATGAGLQGIPLVLESGDKTVTLEEKTGSEGIVIFNDLNPNRSYNIQIKSQNFSASKSGVSVNESIELSANVDITLPQEIKTGLSTAFDILIEQINRISPSFDRTLPQYFLTIASELKGGIDEIAYDSNLYVKNPDGHKILIKEIMTACTELIEGLARAAAQRQNVSLYSDIGSDPEVAKLTCPPLVLKDGFVNKLRNVYDGYSSFESASGVEYDKATSDLYRLDDSLTQEMGKLNVGPLASIWNVYRDVLQNKSSNTENESICSLARGCLIGSALEGLNFILNDPTVRKKLDVGV